MQMDAYPVVLSLLTEYFENELISLITLPYLKLKEIRIGRQSLLRRQLGLHKADSESRQAIITQINRLDSLNYSDILHATGGLTPQSMLSKFDLDVKPCSDSDKRYFYFDNKIKQPDDLIQE